ncbi:MAG: dephospho-CoA kinase [Phycisphaerae bacterium]
MIGLVGGIGAGKSTAAAEFVKLGCRLVDGDVIGHELLAAPEVRRLLRRRWGAGIFNPKGQVDRKALAAVVFGRPRELAALNRIMWPRIRRRMERIIARVRREPAVPAVVMDAAIMIDAGWDELCTHLVFVKAPGRQRAARTQENRGWDRRTWRGRENSQISLDRKQRRCYFTLDNSSSVSYLAEQVRGLFNRIVHEAGRPLAN